MAENIDEQYAEDLAQFAKWRKEEADREKLKAATIAKLGLTSEEIAALLS